LPKGVLRLLITWKWNMKKLSVSLWCHYLSTKFKTSHTINILFLVILREHYNLHSLHTF
jgi:hypothetical protein